MKRVKLWTDDSDPEDHVPGSSAHTPRHKRPRLGESTPGKARCLGVGLPRSHADPAAPAPAPAPPPAPTAAAAPPALPPAPTTIDEVTVPAPAPTPEPALDDVKDQVPGPSAIAAGTLTLPKEDGKVFWFGSTDVRCRGSDATTGSMTRKTRGKTKPGLKKLSKPSIVTQSRCLLSWISNPTSRSSKGEAASQQAALATGSKETLTWTRPGAAAVEAADPEGPEGRLPSNQSCANLARDVVHPEEPQGPHSTDWTSEPTDDVTWTPPSSRGCVWQMELD